MEGSLTNIRPGDWISGGYDFTIPGSHPQRTVTVTNATVTLPVYCPQGGGAGGNIVINLPNATYTDSANNNNWSPTGDQNSVLSWEGAVQAPDLCGGKPMANQSGAIYNATTNTQGGANFRFKYRDPNAKGGTTAMSIVRTRTGIRSRTGTIQLPAVLLGARRRLASNVVSLHQLSCPLRGSLA